MGITGLKHSDLVVDSRSGNEVGRCDAGSQQRQRFKDSISVFSGFPLGIELLDMC